MRIVGGRWAGRDLVSPAGRVRPTAEVVRDAWMELLAPHLEGARVLDLFAGTGALGLEALSRGAATADFVEDSPAALHALKANVKGLRLGKRARIFKRDAIPFADRLPADSYGLAFVDPPYGSRMLDRVIAIWQATPFARVLAAEHDADHVLPPGGRRHLFQRTAVTIYTAAE